MVDSTWEVTPCCLQCPQQVERRGPERAWARCGLFTSKNGLGTDESVSGLMHTWSFNTKPGLSCRKQIWKVALCGTQREGTDFKGHLSPNKIKGKAEVEGRDPGVGQGREAVCKASGATAGGYSAWKQDKCIQGRDRYLSRTGQP